MNNLYKSIILLLILLTIGVAYYNYRTNTYVTAEFKNLRPFHDRAPIYYNGFKIGRVVNVSLIKIIRLQSLQWSYIQMI